MERTIWLIIMIPLSLFFTGIGIFALKSKKPMIFWSGSEVKEREISDIHAYNKANAIMWFSYSAVFWVSLVLGIFKVSVAGFVLAVGVLGGLPLLVIAYSRIYKKYKK